MVIREKPYKQEAFVMETMQVKMELMVQACFNNCSISSVRIICSNKLLQVKGQETRKCLFILFLTFLVKKVQK